jgi:heterodisulfide reductase subunit A-like polyferredoxin
MALKLRDTVDVIAGTYKGDFGTITRFLPVKVEVRLFEANKTRCLSRASLKKKVYRDTTMREQTPWQQTQHGATAGDEEDSVDYLMRVITRLRLTEEEKKELQARIEDEITV